MIRCVILGYGFLGRRLAKELTLNGVEGVKLVGIASSKGYIYRGKGFKPGELPEAITEASDFREGSSL